MTFEPAIQCSVMPSRIEALLRRHRSLDERVAAEQGRPQPDAMVLQMLKREKLRLKDEITRYEGLMRTLARRRATS
jgi:hypothetical protein